MTITADEVVKAAAPIAEKLGIALELWIDSGAENEVQINGLYYRAVPAMDMILGLIVARCFAFELDYDGLRLEVEGGEAEIPQEDDAPPLFFRACATFARAHGLEAAQ